MSSKLWEVERRALPRNELGELLAYYGYIPRASGKRR